MELIRCSYDQLLVIAATDFGTNRFGFLAVRCDRKFVGEIPNCHDPSSYGGSDLGRASEEGI